MPSKLRRCAAGAPLGPVAERRRCGAPAAGADEERARADKWLELEQQLRARVKADEEAGARRLQELEQQMRAALALQREGSG